MTTYQTSTGHHFSTGEWLDIHFDAAKPEYEMMIKNIGIKKGWNILDAGCGNGRFLDTIDKLVGSKGSITALDLAPENIKQVKKRISNSSYKSTIKTRVGSIVSLPFKAHSFDAIWCSAVTQYLKEDELQQTLQEFKRVLKPGGLLAIKEYDGTAAFFYPLPGLTLLWRSVDTMNTFDRDRWLMHPLEMHTFVTQASFQRVSQKTTLVERRQPLRPIEVEYIEELIRTGQMCWSIVEETSKGDQKHWNSVLSKTSPAYLLKQSNFYWREGHIVTTGRG